MYAPRKVCSKCGSVNHIAMHCKVVVPPMISPSIPTLVDQNFNGLAQLPFLPNPYYLYGNANMSFMPWSTPSVNNSFAYTYPENVSKSYSQPRNSVKAKGQRPSPKVKVDLTSSKPKEEKQVPKPRHQLIDLDPKQFGYQNQNELVFECVSGEKEESMVLG